MCRPASRRNVGVVPATRAWASGALLPSDIKPDKVSAEPADGVLTLTVPKSEQAKPRQVEVAG